MQSHSVIIETLGGVTCVAKSLKLRPDVVRKWLNRNRIPAEYWDDLARKYPRVKISALQSSMPARKRKAA